MQLELNATQLNLIWIKIPKLDKIQIHIELHLVELNQIQFNSIQYKLIEFKPIFIVQWICLQVHQPLHCTILS